MVVLLEDGFVSGESGTKMAGCSSHVEVVMNSFTKSSTISTNGRQRALLLNCKHICVRRSMLL